ncbi:hypothetical protein EUZ85_09915 [Hahella sp. KA22]|uniref:Uncharacterized protein n=1 Tax=Hahella chejuensis (strain KCTC 2396) TaxID=349521 RepID=Q2SC17_HAHCH|nr:MULTISPECIES: hypothetical protein [Hahella]ABC31807.1 hypothetical protein HCH_05127 [Hahella chejuensis KCTC 2396]AZZ91021.1 hypothetical protein ENC22_07360 [Hahella sp. KA22]QAY54391.1 hypothetical protein EUZ85_09915 [Hahella sp. KA22]WLQ14756.1 hypothetical protein O5O45_02245 [Hahella sp. HNIBRBA332]
MAEVSNNFTSMTLDDASNFAVPDSPEAMNAMLKDLYAQAEKNAMEREILSLIHKLIMDAIKKIGQAA